MWSLVSWTLAACSGRIVPLAASFGVEIHAPLQLGVPVNTQGLRGVLATGPIQRGDRLLSIPLRSCVAVPRGEYDDWALATALLQVIDSSNDWQAYRAGLLPAEPTDAAFLWSEQEIEKLQLEAAIVQAKTLRERWVTGTAIDDDGVPGAAEKDFEAQRWALSVRCALDCDLDCDLDYDLDCDLDSKRHTAHAYTHPCIHAYRSCTLGPLLSKPAAADIHQCAPSCPSSIYLIISQSRPSSTLPSSPSGRS